MTINDLGSLAKNFIKLGLLKTNVEIFLTEHQFYVLQNDLFKNSNDGVRNKPMDNLFIDIGDVSFKIYRK